MEKLLLAGLLGLAACSSTAEKPATGQAPKADPAQAAVTAYLKKNLDDPTSYQPARWGKPEAWRQQDADRLAADSVTERANMMFDFARKAARYTTKEGTRYYAECVAETEMLQKRADSLGRSTNATELGRVLTHAYRARNRTGAIQLDSARFIIYKNGQVERLKNLTALR